VLQAQGSKGLQNATSDLILGACDKLLHDLFLGGFWVMARRDHAPHPLNKLPLCGAVRIGVLQHRDDALCFLTLDAVVKICVHRAQLLTQNGFFSRQGLKCCMRLALSLHVLPQTHLRRCILVNYSSTARRSGTTSACATRELASLLVEHRFESALFQLLLFTFSQ
jgi:hypothetical protein